MNVVVVGLFLNSEKIMSAQEAEEAKIAQEQEVIPQMDEPVEALPPAADQEE